MLGQSGAHVAFGFISIAKIPPQTTATCRNSNTGVRKLDTNTPIRGPWRKRMVKSLSLSSSYDYDYDYDYDYLHS